MFDPLVTPRGALRVHRLARDLGNGYPAFWPQGSALQTRGELADFACKYLALLFGSSVGARAISDPHITPHTNNLQLPIFDCSSNLTLGSPQFPTSGFHTSPPVRQGKGGGTVEESLRGFRIENVYMLLMVYKLPPITTDLPDAAPGGSCSAREAAAKPGSKAGRCELFFVVACPPRPPPGG